MSNVITPIAAIGIDLGDNDSNYACLNDTGELTEEGRVAMTPAAFRKTFGAFEPTRIAIEAGAQSRWVAKLLEEIGHQVVVANPRQLKLISSSNSKNDVNDARMLARLVRFDPGLLSPLHHRSEREQVTLLAIRARDQLVKSRVALMHSVRGMVKGFGVRLPRATSDQFLERCKSSLPPEMLPHLEGLFTVIDQLTRQIATYDEMIEKTAADQYPEINNLRSISGIGTLTALTFVTTLADPSRFAKSRDVGSYLGLRPKQQQSGSQNPQLGITKAGDVYLRKLLVQSAHCVLREHAPDTALRQWGLKLCQRGGGNAKKRAIAAVARKLAVLLHKLWISGDTYKPFPAT